MFAALYFAAFVFLSMACAVLALVVVAAVVYFSGRAIVRWVGRLRRDQQQDDAVN